MLGALWVQWTLRRKDVQKMGELLDICGTQLKIGFPDCGRAFRSLGAELEKALKPNFFFFAVFFNSNNRSGTQTSSRPQISENLVRSLLKVSTHLNQSKLLPRNTFSMEYSSHICSRTSHLGMLKVGAQFSFFSG